VNTGITRTLRGSPVVEAPGKVFLVGEYAVLEGGAAVLAAVSRHAVGQYLPELTPESPVIAETVARAVEALGALDLGRALPAGSVLVNTAGFRQGASKLGLGSSAAAAVAAAGAVLAFVGVDIAARRDLLFGIADEGHRAAQGGIGSGGDIAASVHGGFIGYLRAKTVVGEKPGKPIIRKLSRPGGLELRVFWTGAGASTPSLIRAVHAFAGRQPAVYRGLIDELRQTAEQFVHAFLGNDAKGAILHADGYGRLLEKLGASAEVPIVTPPFAETAVVARGLGGAAKPSGAGGGDVGVALFTDEGAAAEFTRRCPPGVSVLDVNVDPDGARRRQPGTVELI
jgi:phosphomevalonate kinase